MTKPDLSPYRDRMDKAIAALRDEFSGLRTGRASAGLIEHVQVEAYGTTSPITAVASISVPEPRLITVNVWDRGLTVAVEKAVRNAGIGLNPQVDGQTLRIPIPPLTEDRRKELVKLAGKYAEEHKIAVRNVRRDGMEALKADESKKEIAEDERKRGETEVQKLTDDMIKAVDDVAASKEKEILGK